MIRFYYGSGSPFSWRVQLVLEEKGLPYEPVLKAICARNADRAQSFAAKWGYESAETDWRKVVESPEIGTVEAQPPKPQAGATPPRASAGLRRDPRRHATSGRTRRWRDRRYDESSRLRAYS